MTAANRTLLALAVGLGITFVLVAACGFDSAGEAVAITEAGPNDTSSGGSDTASSVESGSSGGDAADAESDGGNEAGEAGEAGIDAGPCPTACSSCNGSTCVIDCPGAKCQDVVVTCPAGRPCRIGCAQASSCVNKRLECPAGQPCTIACAADACSSMTIGAGTAQSLCLTCSGTGGSPGCNSLTCTKPTTCTKHCAAGGNGCNGIGDCDGCNNIPGACP